MAQTTSTSNIFTDVFNDTDSGCCDEGLLLPIFNECDWPKSLRAVLYLLGLLYLFFGVSIAADVFMSAIERITSQTRVVKSASSEFGSVDEGLRGVGDTNSSNVKEVRVWNPTIANLTLMALGSSAPEILLSLIEIVGNNFRAGALGPSTIVGSAAFNLLVITAVCIVTIPKNETRKIDQIYVFAVTSTFCILAYLWMLVILKAVTSSVVSIWEAVVTLLLFLILIIIAYFADRRFFVAKFHKTTPTLVAEAPEEIAPAIFKDEGWKSPVTIETTSIRKAGSKTNSARQKSDWLEVQRRMALQYPDSDAETLARLVAEDIDSRQPHPKSYYRIRASGNWLGPTVRKPVNNLAVSQDGPNERGGSGRSRPRTALSNAAFENKLAFPSSKLAIIEFAAEKYAVRESEKVAQIRITRTGRLNRRILVRYETLDGTAHDQYDYIAKSDLVIFNPDETDKTVNIDLITDKEHEPDEMFYIKLSLEDYGEGKTVIGKNNITQVVIIDSDKEPRFQFITTSMVVKESEGRAFIPVSLRGGVQEKASVSWSTKDGTAHAGKDYIGGTGILHFGPGEMEKHIEIDIIDDKELEKHESFSVTLMDASDGVTVSTKKNRCVVTVLNDDEMTLLLTQADRLVPTQLKSLQPGSQSWKQQFVAAANVNGGDIDSAGVIDYILHVVTFAWKMLFACVPPASMAGGWLTFIIALALIGMLTAVVGDLASIFGCIVGLKPSVTAITIVAIGTSLPDLFASKLAATQEKSADNSIGNVTGSNSVNVFLGLGISWLVAAIYHQRKSGTFVVPDSGLAFSVTIYCITAAMCIALLVARRLLPLFGRSELGGPTVSKWISAGFLVTLWFIYVLLSTLQAYDVIQGF